MSRYLILLILNLPFIALAILGAITKFKLKHTAKKQFIMQIILWLTILIGLIAAEPIYDWLFQHQMTQTEPLSLFDVIQITAIIFMYYLSNRSRMKIERLEERLQDLHQELSIKLSTKK